MSKQIVKKALKKQATGALVSKRGAPVAQGVIPSGDVEALKGAYIGENGQCIYIDMGAYIDFKELRIKSRINDPTALIPLQSWGAHYGKIARAEYTELEIWKAFMSPTEKSYLWDIDFLEQHFKAAFESIIEDIKNKYISK